MNIALWIIKSHVQINDLRNDRVSNFITGILFASMCFLSRASSTYDLHLSTDISFYQFAKYSSNFAGHPHNFNMQSKKTACRVNDRKFLLR